MSDEKQNEANEPEDGRVLPAREMMSVIADPADPMSPALLPEDPHPVGTEAPPPGDTMPIEGPDADESESQPTE